MCARAFVYLYGVQFVKYVSDHLTFQKNPAHKRHQVSNPPRSHTVLIEKVLFNRTREYKRALGIRINHYTDILCRGLHCIHSPSGWGANSIMLQVEGHRGHAACPSRLGPD